jgi:hypothetical protein
MFKNLFSNAQYSNIILIYVHSINICNARQDITSVFTVKIQEGSFVLNDTSPGKWLSFTSVRVTPEATRWRSMSRRCYVAKQST